MAHASAAPSRRPLWVWVILLWFAFSLASTTWSLWVIFSGSVAVTPEMAAYFRGLTFMDHAFTVLPMVLNLAGAVTLFMLRKIAVPLFAASLAVSVVATAFQVLTKDLSGVLEAPAFVGLGIGYGILAAVCAYAWTLRARGRLS